MKFSISANGDYISMTLGAETASERAMLEAFEVSKLPVIAVEKVEGGVKVTRRAAHAPTEETGNTR